MNFMRNTRSFLQRSKWLSVSAQKTTKTSEIIYNKKVHSSQNNYQKSLPPITKKDLDQEDELLSKNERLQKDIFGATILPPNLSFENSKKLTENQVRLEDIPLIDDSKDDETASERIRAAMKGDIVKKNSTLAKEMVKPLGIGEPAMTENVLAISSGLVVDSKDKKISPAELFWIADPYENIPGPKMFKTFLAGLKKLTRQLTVLSMLKFLKYNVLTPFRMYGPIVKLPEALGGKIVLISRPEHIEAVLEQDRRHPVSSILDSIQRSRIQRRRNTYKKGFHLQSSDWDDVKKSNSGPLRKDIDSYLEDVDDICAKFVNRIRTIRNKQNEVPDEFLFEINKWSLECLCFVIFDKSFGFLDYESASCPSKTSQLFYSLTVATRSLCHMESGLQLWRFLNTSSLSSLGSTCEILESIISECVAQAQLGLVRRQKNPQGYVSLVEGLLLQDVLTPDDIVTNIMDTLLIGMNTMSTTLGFLLYHVSKHPRVQREIWKEVKAVYPKSYSRLQYKQLSSLKYIKACLKESIRLNMPMPLLTRVLSNNITICNYQIPKGTFVLMAPQVEAMKEENFEESSEFLPERWLDQENIHPLTTLPLGSYFHDSFERRIAEAAIEMCTAMIMKHFLVDYSYGDIESTNTALSFPNKPLKFTFNDRKYEAD